MTAWMASGRDHEILVVRGMRRTGKTVLLRQLAAALVRDRVPGEDIVFANLEHDVFDGEPGPAELQQVLDLHRASSSGRRPFLLLDEIQAARDWTRWALRVLETGQAYLAVSGSTSQLMPEDVAPLLTGRRRSVTVWPLSFREFLRFRGFHDLGDQGDRAILPPLADRHVGDYLVEGGMPYVADVRLTDDERERYLAGVFGDILLRDVTARHEVRRVRSLDRLARHYLRNTGNEVTLHSLKKRHGLAIDQARDYTSYLERAFLIRFVPRLSFRSGRRDNEPLGKVYAVDTGMRNAVTFRHSADSGHLAETAVHAELLRDRRAGVRVFHHTGRRGCDFVVWRGEDAERVVQVYYQDPDLPSERAPLPDRELDGLLEAAEHVRLHDGAPAEIVTSGAEWSRRIGGREVRAVSLARWLLDRAHERNR